MINNPTRRGVLLGGAASLAILGTPSWALNTAQAKGLIDEVVTTINQIINSGASLNQMIGKFETLFGNYADLRFISFKTLGPPARSASSAQMKAYTNAFRGYMARKYGKRFGEFIGGKIEVKRAKAVKSFFEVETRAILRGKAPFDVSFFVSDKSGRDLFFDMRIEGVSVVNSEKEEIGAMLDRRGGDLNRLIADLKKLG